VSNYKNLCIEGMGSGPAFASVEPPLSKVGHRRVRGRGGVRGTPSSWGRGLSQRCPGEVLTFGSGAKMLPDQNGPGGPTQSSGCKLIRDRELEEKGRRLAFDST